MKLADEVVSTAPTISPKGEPGSWSIGSRGIEQQLQREHTSDLKRPRSIIAWSRVGMASMIAVTLLQTGISSIFPIGLLATSIPIG